MRLIPIVLVLFVALVSQGSAQDEQQFARDKEAFLTARKAATVKTWDAALELLEEIRLSKIEDNDVIEYVVFSKLCAKTANALGVDRNSNPQNPTDVISKIDWGTLITTLAQKAASDPTGFLALLNDARKVRNGIKNYEELDRKLVLVYRIK